MLINIKRNLRIPGNSRNPSNHIRMLIGALISAATLLGASSGLLAATLGESFPQIATTHIGTSKTGPVQTAGKVTVINFWATWCESCKVELKEMETDFKGLFGESDVQLKFVSLDKDPTKAAEWFKNNLNGSTEMMDRLFADPEFKAADLVGVDSFPMTIIIDKMKSCNRLKFFEISNIIQAKSTVDINAINKTE